MELSDKQIEILIAAEKVFGRRGIDAASVREIAKEANINIAMISYYFGSKDKLVENLFSWRISTFNTALELISQNTTLSPFEKLQGVLKAYLNRILDKPEFHRIMAREYSKRDSILEVDNKINELKIKNLDYITNIIHEGNTKGIFKRKAPAEAVVMVVIGGTSYLILNEKTYMKQWGLTSHEEFTEHIHKEYYPYLIDSLKAILLYDEK
ncbi:TetR/AcrR family transcriptional regulator [Empedobacter brevis]|uniref:TetR/AcrR family transcriptional regulator n=1 Tax=Empedobacter brevis TaxID=247 RepID=UPI0023F3F065|nr:TetR/AcrR family transcriptional regulator [Empedobacter brevis]